jgi:hypothetical protein
MFANFTIWLQSYLAMEIAEQFCMGNRTPTIEASLNKKKDSEYWTDFLI